MDGFILSIIIPLATIILYYLVRASYSLWWKPKMLEKQLKQQGIKGTSYKFLIGNVKDFIEKKEAARSKPMNLNHQIAARVTPFSHDLAEKHGKVSFCWAGPTPQLAIKEPEMMKQVLSNKKGHFRKPYFNPQALILTRGLFTLEGEEWAKHRKIINPAFHMEKLKEMVPVMEKSCCEFISKWKKLTNSEGSCELDVWPELQNLTADVIARTAFGNSYQEGAKVFQLQKELLGLTAESMQTLYIPGFRYIPTKKNQRRRKLDKMITSMFTDLIQKKESAIKGDESQANDLLGLLLLSNNQNNASESSTYEGMDIEEVIEECKQFYVAGYETTASLLTWTMIVLAMHPDWQEKAREEVLRVCGRNPIDFKATTKLKTVTMILQEVLRLYPPGVAQLQHTCKETKVGDITIPAGVDITLLTLLIHHDPDIWGADVDEFNPLRFSEGAAKASKDQVAFFPFGWGPRTCIGQNFSLIEAKVALSLILQNFSFQLSPLYVHAPDTVLILQPQHGAPIVLHSLSSPDCKES